MRTILPRIALTERAPSLPHPQLPVRIDNVYSVSYLQLSGVLPYRFNSYLPMTTSGPETTPQTAVPSTVAPTTPRHAPRFLIWTRDLFISLAVSLFIIVFLYQPVKVEGTSMMPNLSDQERIFINKFVYHWEAIERGDVVVFKYPRDTSKSYIKRVIGLPGDRVAIDEGRVYVNGELLRESYVPDQYTDDRSYEEITVPQHSYFLLGDHRNLSNDSRDFGPVYEKYIYGKAVFAYWPVEKLGKLR